MLRKLASSYGVQTGYLDVDQKRVASNPDSLAAVLRALGAPLQSTDDAHDALRARRLELVRRVLPPVISLWDDSANGVRMTLPAELGSRSLDATLHLENGDVRDWSPSARTVLRAHDVEGTKFLTIRLSLPSLPHGYHRLAVSLDGAHYESLIVRAPTRSFRDPTASKRWGLFAPIYALHSRDSDGVGNFTDLAKLMRLTRDHGGGFVSTLPFFASFPSEPSPYSPMSRLFWNELFIDTGNAAIAPPVTPLDYPSLYGLHRSALVHLKRDAHALAAFEKRCPLVVDYARFRAALTQHATPWNRWPGPQRSGVVQAQDVDADEVLYHLYNQLHAEEQIHAHAGRGLDLYLDLPLGCTATDTTRGVSNRCSPMMSPSAHRPTPLLPKVKTGAPRRWFPKRAANRAIAICGWPTARRCGTQLRCASTTSWDFTGSSGFRKAPISPTECTSATPPTSSTRF